MVREKSVKSQGISFQTKSGHPDFYFNLSSMSIVLAQEVVQITVK